jgi:hypothetical protein
MTKLRKPKKQQKRIQARIADFDVSVSNIKRNGGDASGYKKPGSCKGC